jgi:hypothetical protein
VIKSLHYYFWSMHSFFSELYVFISRRIFMRQIRLLYNALRSEAELLARTQPVANQDTFVLVGAGFLPYTALYYRRFFHRVYCIERNWFVCLCASWYLTRKKRGANITFVRQDGCTYTYPNDAVICITLLTKGKKRVFERSRLSKRSRICVRAPLEKTRYRYESLDDECVKGISVELPELGMKSILVDTNPMQ